MGRSVTARVFRTRRAIITLTDTTLIYEPKREPTACCEYRAAILLKSIWNWAIARRGPAYVSVYSYAVPVLAGVISFLLFGDSLSSGQIAGAGIVFAGMLLARWGALRVAKRARGETRAKLRAKPRAKLRQPSQRSKQPLYAMPFI